MGKKSSYKTYTQEAAIEFVHYLGLWSFANLYEAAKDKRKRSDQEFREILNQLIKVNQGRKDQVGELETAAAKRELAMLGQ